MVTRQYQDIYYLLSCGILLGTIMSCLHTGTLKFSLLQTFVLSQIGSVSLLLVSRNLRTVTEIILSGCWSQYIPDYLLFACWCFAAFDIPPELPTNPVEHKEATSGMNPFWWAWTFNRILKNTLEQNITALGNCYCRNWKGILMTNTPILKTQMGLTNVWDE